MNGIFFVCSCAIHASSSEKLETAVGGKKTTSAMSVFESGIFCFLNALLS